MRHSGFKAKAATFTHLSPLVQSVVSAIPFYEARDRDIVLHGDYDKWLEFNVGFLGNGI